MSLGLLNFSYKLFARKHASYIVLPNIRKIDESNLIVDDVLPLSGHVRRRLLKFLMQEDKALPEIIDMSSAREGVWERLIQMLSPKVTGALSSHAVVPYVEKNDVTFDID